MSKIFFAELTRALKSVCFWILIIILAIVNSYEVLFSDYGSKTYITSFLFSHMNLLCIMISVFIPLNTGLEFEYRTINNKITAGTTKKQFYLAETIVNSLISLILLLIDIFFVTIFCFIKNYSISSTSLNAFPLCINVLIALISLCTVSTISTLIVMLAHQRIISIIIAIALCAGLLVIGSQTVSDLNQPKYSSLYSSTDTLEPNPLYLSEEERNLPNLHLLVSPFAQSNFMSYVFFETKEEKKNNSLISLNNLYHVEFVIVDIIEIFAITIIGLYLFQKQDLK